MVLLVCCCERDEFMKDLAFLRVVVTHNRRVSTFHFFPQCTSEAGTSIWPPSDLGHWFMTV